MSMTLLSLVFIIFIACFILERAFRGWELPKVGSWPFRVILVNLVQLAVVYLAAISWEEWFHSISFFRLDLTPWIGGLFAYFIATFIFYWWHRWRHESDFLWKVFHQIHHSPQRLEVITSFYKHPIEMIVNSILGATLVYFVLGLPVEAGAVYTFCTAIGEFFYHTNMKTPRWVGFVFQRPEMHRIHHQYNLHKYNYGDIVWWDMLFGTYRNPKEFTATCGFDPEKEEALLDMLAFEDVHRQGKL